MPSKMPSDKRATVARFSMKTLSAAVMSALLVSNAYAAGLGRMTVLSGLGQPLRAEIELTAVSKDEVGALAAKLASAEAFRQANIDFNGALLSLRFNVENRGDRHFIRVSSTQPLNEPFVDMLLELNGPNGRLIREYTFLLDPPELRTTQAAAVAPAAVPELGASGTQAMPAPSAPASSAPVAARPAPAPTRAATAPATEAAAGDYQVRQGDTLMQIAARVKPSNVSLDQMLVALYQGNPDAFAEKNMNRLKAGQILSVPSADTAAAVDAGAARSMIVAQAADFNAYRQRLAGQVASASAQRSAETRQDAGGRITARVEERATPASDARDKLQLSAATAAAGGAASAEDLIARDKALAEAQSRVKELEKNVSDLQKLLELKSQSLAEQQKQAEAAKAAPATPAAPAAAPVPAAPVAAAPAEAKPEAAPQAAAEPKAEAPAPAAAPPVAAAPQPAVKPAPKVVVEPPPPPPSLVDDLLENPFTLPGLGLLLVALGGLGFYRVRRQKKGKQFEDSIITDSSLKANSLFGSTGGQSVDTNNSVFNSSFTPSVSQLDSNEVDPVAEADVYIAYGRDAQAEEILKEALRTQPDRHAVRVKLLEIYSNRKDLRAFEVMATELYGMTKGSGDEWAQAAAMGLAIDPNNPLYASAKDAMADAGDMVAPTQPLEEQGLATLLAEGHGDTAPMDTISSLQTDTSYFTNTESAQEEPAAPEPVRETEQPKAQSNELDFDLEGMNLDVEVPNTIPRPAPAEPAAELATIDFDFLDTKAAAVAEAKLDETQAPADEALEAPEVPEEPVAFASPAAAQPSAMPTLDELELALNEMAAQQPALSSQPAEITLDIGNLDFEPVADAAEEPVAEQAAAPASAQPVASTESGPMDFDLSDISLELDAEPADMGLDDGAAAGEMATKLDLAIAYQEIGDKEGARELLDEVVKGGTPEQTEKAKSLLLELA